MLALVLVTLASASSFASPVASLKALLPTARVAGELALDVTGDDASLDPHDRAHVTLTNHGEPLSGLLHTGDSVRVSLDAGTTTRWSYSIDATDAIVASTSLTLPLLPEADEPYPGEEPRDGIRTVVDHLYDIGDPGQALTATVSVYNTRTSQWVALGRTAVNWNLDRLSIGALEKEQNARFHDALAAQNTWPEAASQDATARKTVAALVSKAVPTGDKVLGWNLGGAGWVLVRNPYGIVTQDQWFVNVGYRHGEDCFLGEVKLVRDYVGTRPGTPRITGTSPTTARPIRCEAIGS